VIRTGCLQMHAHLAHWLLPLQMSQQSQHWSQWQQKHSLQQMPSQMLEHLTSQMLEHSLQKISVFSYGQTINSKANLGKHTIYLGCTMDMSSVLLTCINDEPSGIILWLDDAAMDFPLVCLDCAGSIASGVLWLALVAGWLDDPVFSCCYAIQSKLVKWVRNEYIAVRGNSKFSKHHFHSACPRVVTIIATATTSNFSTNFWRLGSRFHRLWRVFSPIFLWLAWHLFYSRRQWFGVRRHRPSRLMFHRLQYMLVCLLVCLKWEALMYVIVRLLRHFE
jgi:hypothetical protein